MGSDWRQSRMVKAIRRPEGRRYKGMADAGSFSLDAAGEERAEGIAMCGWELRAPFF